MQVLIQDQSVGLVDEVSEEVRERLVTADILVEMLLQKVLRRPPRQNLKGPIIPSGNIIIERQIAVSE